MSKNNLKKPLAIAMGATFVAAMSASPAANADSNPFGMQSMSGGYMQVAEGKCGGSKAQEAKCGEGMKAKEAKCGEGKCGEGKKAKEGKCGEGKCGEGMKAKEGKCGEGKCGEGMKAKEGKCGGKGAEKSKEGKCGGEN